MINTKLWDDIGELGKNMLRMTGSSSGCVFLEKQGRVAAVIIARDEAPGVSPDIRREVATLRLFRERLDEMIAHAEDEKLTFGDGTQTFVRDEETGEYEEQK